MEKVKQMNSMGKGRISYMGSIHLKRVLTTPFGLVYMVLGLAIFTLLSVLFTTVPGRAGGVGISILYGFSPISATIGSVGIAYFLSNDRANGVYEYILSSGELDIKGIYLSYLIADSVLIAMILSIQFIILYVLVAITGATNVFSSIQTFFEYSIPVSFFSSYISAITMLTWASMSKRYVGINSPGGLGSIVGLSVPLAYYIVSIELAIKIAKITYLPELFTLIDLLVFLAVLVVSIRLAKPERLLSV